ncbi:hypothetical protein PHYBLDRAFT_59810 [Phycomyces blakesleeanus NRRL 1555(-)]|uniref:Postreplication repair E3 ubiquitin-protein ligase RAD18 n=1 Tax=Phycomyces blakesleeanus (strain ATCC 8743b / DSM 1359 / FGSC 10004 / NBRC 33097 / NRRL 1555) TaxID=763407 RepID=A0A162XRF7_PHYB8|nr:hypothetical protein PHYBLDRAFT_59810 [Phycomyces blakesleeanus NRRL 1555(-)]OAD76275.1 hypothetical protein PHYBLDRAFT_59810 [Phycomyces blakesleeanus NRRL 1555(-)]|eukprot:XP_018294315.1 hypothetical protein PHYBLDRAFT_59810 [Phycomyces blakesleeanus NRRL 1555(-)]
MDDFDDPSDFSCYDLQELDKHMRCPICKELVQTPMILASCSHTFCAGCIRRSMVRELCCPLCREPTNENISVVTCPVCSQTMLMSELNSHIDQCATSDAHAFHPFMPRVTHPQIKCAGNPPKKPTKFVYGMQSDKDMRNILKDLGLDTHGDKRRMIWRHKEYSLLYSINEDSRNPLDARELRQKLKTTESEYFSTQKKIPIATIDPEEYNILLTKKKS